MNTKNTIEYIKYLPSIFSLFIKTTIDWTKQKFTHKQFILLASVLVGVSAGFAAVVLKFLLHFIYLSIIDNQLLHSYYFYAVLPITGILTTVISIRILSRKKKFFKGLPGLLMLIHKKSGIIPRIHMYGQIITSSLTVGFGGSAGVEAPIVITGASFGSNFARTYRLSHKDRILLLACGVAAGIAGTRHVS